MKLNTSTWKKVRFGDLIPEGNIYKAKAYSKDELEIAKYPNEDTIPYVTRTEPNNSVEAFIEENNLDGIEFGNALVVGDTTATVSYQRDPFVAGDHIVVIRAPWLNEFTGLFFETLLNKERFRYSYGRAFIKDLIKDTILFIPCDKKGQPDFLEMERIIKEMHYKPLTTKNIKTKNKSIDFNNWKCFKVRRIFKKIDVKKHSSIPDTVGMIPFVSSTGLNNGVSSYVNEKSIDGNCITVSTNGGCFDSFYHQERIAISTDVDVLYSKYLNPKIALFICTILKQEKYKWSYGRKPKNNKVYITDIYLPAKKDNKGVFIIDSKNEFSDDGYIPDWDYMEKYISNLPYGDVL